MEHTTSQPRFVLPRLSLETAGILTLLFGAWAGIVSFVGPTFAFSGDGSGSWHWNLAHALLFLVPGGAACIAGLLAIFGAASGKRMVLGFAGLLAVVCGGWLIMGPVAWPVLEGGSVFRTGVPALRELAFWIGYSLGPGALLVALGAFILGRDRLQIMAPEERYVPEVAPR
jgi:hypothetical protein